MRAARELGGASCVRAVLNPCVSTIVESLAKRENTFLQIVVETGGRQLVGRSLIITAR